jgi:hypothetical protein
VDEKNDQIALRTIVAGREILRNDERNSNSPETGLFRPSNAVRACLIKNGQGRQCDVTVSVLDETSTVLPLTFVVVVMV